MIRRLIADRYPEHGIYGEEHGYEPGVSGLTWVIDPIDGTRAFITGQVHWGILVALYDGEKPVLGGMHQPFTGEMFTGGPGGAFLSRGGERPRLAVRDCPSLADAVLCCTTPEMFQQRAEREAFARLEAGVRLRRFGGDCYSYCMLAHGLVDLVVEADLAPYDVQGLIPVVQGAWRTGGGLRRRATARGGARGAGSQRLRKMTHSPLRPETGLNGAQRLAMGASVGFGSDRINHLLNPRHLCGREATARCMLLDEILVVCNVDAEGLVAGHVGMFPLDALVLGPHGCEDGVGFLRSAP